MGDIEEDEPPLKRVKVLSEGSYRHSYIEELPCKNLISSSLGEPMARPLMNRGDGDKVGSKGIIKKPEFIRVITRALYSLGYGKAGALLEEESGIPLYSSVVSLLMQQVLDGKWNESVVTLHSIGISDEALMKSATFLILEQKFFEFLSRGWVGVSAALETLRTEIVPLCTNSSRVHDLAACVISSSFQYELLGYSIEDIGVATFRSRALEKLKKLLPASVMILEKRLEHLVEQALDAQRDACTFHNTFDSELSLYSDHQCGKNHIPSRTLTILQEHSDEVWFVQFSHNGKYLASASKDQSATIWKVDQSGLVILKCKLHGHQKPVVTVSWSPDDNQLLTCGLEEVIRRWDVNTGQCLHIYEKNNVGPLTCEWFPNGKLLFSGMTDKSICMWNLDGTEIRCWKDHGMIKISDIDVSENGKVVVSRCRENEISLFHIEKNVKMLVKEDDAISSFSLSKDNKFLLVNLINQEIHLWSIVGDLKVVRRYKGHKRDRFLIRSCFGGFEEAFIASGSEDSQVYIWHRSITEPLLILPGHSGAVNCVSWNPTNLHMLASASDDGTVRVWGLEDQIKMNRTFPCSNGTVFVHHSNGTA